MHPSLRIIESEHRSISAVLDGLAHFADQGLEKKPVPDARVFRAMLQYLDLFAERMHHPKEDLYLFAALRRHGCETHEVLGRLEGDHQQGVAAIRALEQAFLHYEEGGAPFFEAFARRIKNYTTFYREHMRAEEKVIFPLAEELLDEEDWRQIDIAFATHVDPLASPAEERDLKALFTRIVTITPSPIGVGPEIAKP